VICRGSRPGGISGGRWIDSQHKSLHVINETFSYHQTQNGEVKTRLSALGIAILTIDDQVVVQIVMGRLLRLTLEVNVLPNLNSSSCHALI
jgi:hypothetical protein